MIWKPIAALLICLGLGLLVAHAQLLQTGVGRGSATGVSGPFLQLVCPSGGLVSVPSTNFTVTYNSGTFNGTTNTVSMSDGAAGGTFTPVSPATPAAGASFTFTYTPPATPGTYTITVSDNFAVTVIGSPCSYNATSALTQALPIGIP